MKKISKNKIFKLYLLLTSSMMGIEIIFKLVSNIKVFDFTILRIFLGISIISIFLAYFYSLCSEKVSKIFSLLTIFIFSVYAFLQLGFMSFLGVYMSLNTTSQLNAVKDYIRDFLNSFSNLYYLIFIPFIMALIYVIISNKYFKITTYEKYPLRTTLIKKRLFSFGISLILMTFLGYGYYKSLGVQDNLQTISNLTLFKSPTVPSVAVKNFGLIGYGLDDLRNFYDPSENREVYYAQNDQEVTDNTRTFDDTNWENITENETDETLKNIDTYLLNSDSSDINAYTGILENKNVIIIMMESAGEILINPEYYPNFYKMYSEGYSFTNNYSPRNACATGNNEFSAITSLYSIYNNCTANVYKDNVYPESLFNLFNKKGYKTVSMHDYTDQYYERHTIHPNLGVSAYYGVDELGIPYETEYKNWASDEDFANVAMDIMLNNNTSNNPFMLWMTSVSSHQPYSVSSITGDEYASLFANTGYSEEVIRYMSKLKILDNALGILMSRLEAAGKLDDTVFVMFGDHYPYGLPLEEINEVLPYSLTDYENERTPMAIYNSALTPTKFKQYTSYINLTPTLANLFNLDYDPRLYMGEDILSDNYESKVTFADGSWKNSEVYYNATNSSLTYYTDNSYDNQKIIDINNEINAKMNMSSMIIKNNYYDDLDMKLKAKEAEKSILAEREE